MHFIVPRERDCHDIYNSLLQLSKQAKYEDLYAFSYNPKQNDLERQQGWQLIDLAKEYERMGVPNSNWQLSDANREYKVPSQPSGGVWENVGTGKSGATREASWLCVAVYHSCIY